MASKGKTTSKVPITMRALLQRINRKLASEGRAGQALKTARGRYATELGDYYIVDLDRNTVEVQHVDPVKLGRELGVLAAFEEVAS